MVSDNIIFLLGAGASHDAGLKTADEMTDELEAKLSAGTWHDKYGKLYNAVKAGILYGDALRGVPHNRINIEEFVNVLTELQRCKDHTIFPFIASWNMELMETAGKNFRLIQDFRRDIVKELVENWVKLQEPIKARYYRNMETIANGIGSNLRVFSLNYDMCFELGCSEDSVFTGFLREEGRDGKVWKDRLLRQDDEMVFPIRLYKLHGSVNWRKLGDGALVSYDFPHGCENADEYQLIFGTANKMRYTEPYLFLLSEFWEYASRAKLIVCIGYNYQDSHINSILNHAFQCKPQTRLLSVTWAEESARDQIEKSEISRIAKALAINESQVTVTMVGAREFMEKTMSVEYLSGLMSLTEPLF